MNGKLMTIAAALTCAASMQGLAGEPSPARATLTASAASRGAETATMRPGEQAARAAAARGPDALRRYIDRTRMIHALRYEDFAR